MAKVKFGHGYVWTIKNGKRKNVDSLNDGLEDIANCSPCGCSTCFGYTTHLNAETGEIVMKWITGTGTEEDPYVENIDDYDAGLIAVKALKVTRDEPPSTSPSASASSSGSSSVSPSSSTSASISSSPSTSESSSVSSSISSSISSSPSA